jgi:hypothetical protein
MSENRSSAANVPICLPSASFADLSRGLSPRAAMGVLIAAVGARGRLDPSPTRDPGIARIPICAILYSESASTSAFITADSAPSQLASPHPFPPGRSFWPEHLGVLRRRQGVTHVRAGQQSPPFQHRARPRRLPNTRHDPAGCLAADRHRIDDPDEPVPDHFDVARLGVHFDIGDMAAFRIRARGSAGRSCPIALRCEEGRVVA